jgi:hypothetical protein
MGLGTDKLRPHLRTRREPALFTFVAALPNPACSPFSFSQVRTRLDIHQFIEVSRSPSSRLRRSSSTISSPDPRITLLHPVSLLLGRLLRFLAEPYRAVRLSSGIPRGGLGAFIDAVSSALPVGALVDGSQFRKSRALSSSAKTSFLGS